MNDELIKRIDDWQSKLDGFDYFDGGEAVRLLTACRAALSRSIEDKSTRYVPMSDHERSKWWASEWTNRVMLEKFEAEVIRRAGLEVSNA